MERKLRCKVFRRLLTLWLASCFRALLRMRRSADFVFGIFDIQYFKVSQQASATGGLVTKRILAHAKFRTSPCRSSFHKKEFLGSLAGDLHLAPTIQLVRFHGGKWPLS